MLPAGHCLVLLAGTGLFLLLLHLHTIGLKQAPWPPIGASGSTGGRGPAQNKPDLGKSNLTIVLCKLLPGAAHEKWSRNKLVPRIVQRLPTWDPYNDKGALWRLHVINLSWTKASFFASLDMLTPIFLAFGWRVTLALSGEYIGFFCIRLIEFFSLGDFLSALDKSSDLKQF